MRPEESYSWLVELEEDALSIVVRRQHGSDELRLKGDCAREIALALVAVMAVKNAGDAPRTARKITLTGGAGR